MTRIRCSTLAVLVSLLAWAADAHSAAAQDRFGAGVAVVEGAVLVSKVTPGRGPAAIYVFGNGDDGWTLGSLLTVPGAGDTGEGLSTVMDTDGRTVAIGSGDPGAAWAAHLIETEAGAWSYRGRAPILPGAMSGGADPSAAVSLQTVFQILQPPLRVVAVDGDRMVAARVSAGGGASLLRVLEREPGGEWRVGPELSVPQGTASPLLGAALELRGDRIWAGDPRSGATGAVFGFVLSASGEWVLEAEIRPDSTMAGAAFGSALLDVGDHLLVGAPGANQGTGAVVSVAPADSGWAQRAVLAPEDGAPGDLFGSALAADGRVLLVGAPGHAGNTGAVHTYRRDAGGWLTGGVVPIDGAEPGYRTGSSLAVRDGVAVLGAPGADGAAGRAVVVAFEPAEAWGAPTWLSPGDRMTAVTGSEVRCADGEAAGFQCGDVDLLAYLPVDALGGGPGEGVTDLWGWTDPETGREYALIGRTGGAAIVDVTAPASPIYLGLIPANPSGARDLKVYADHLFFTGDGAGNHGLIVFDLSRLRSLAGSDEVPVTFDPDAVYDGIASAHNLVIDTEAGFAYPVGASGAGTTCGGGLHMIDIREPLNPTFAGCFTDDIGLIAPGRTHDAQCVVYRGPDEGYRGRQVCFVSNETALRLVDVTDKTSPTIIGTASYPAVGYVHQGWLTDDHRYFYLNDELDELVGKTPRTRTFIWDMAELDDPVLVGHVDGPNRSTDHNLYVKGDRMYQANYQAGLRVWDISDPVAPVEVGFFDTTPYDGDPPGFVGAWTAYPYFESGTVVVSSMLEGVFIVRPRRALIP